MPQVQIVDSQSDRPNRAEENLKTFFSNISKEYADRRDKNVLDEIWGQAAEIGENRKSHAEISAALQRSNVSPSKRLETQEQLNQIEKFNIEREKAITNQLKAQQAKQTEFQKIREKKAAENLTKLEDEIPKLQDSISNMDHIMKIAKKDLKGPSGYVKAWTNSKSAKEVENLSAASLDTIIKLFNPAGTLPTAKLNWIRDTFAVKGSDRISTMEGKIKAQKMLAQQALQRAQQKSNLINKYQGNIPPEVEQEFNNETLLNNDAIADQLAFKIKLDQVGSDGLVKGMYDQNGEPLGPIPKEEAIQLFEQGLITNEPK